MEAVIAGWVAGYAMALLTTAALAYLAVGPARQTVEHLLGEGTAPLLMAVPASIGSVIAWTLVGLVFGLVYDLTAASMVPFLVGTTAVAIVPLPFLLLLAPRQGWLWLALAAAFVVLFGALMPYLAER